MRSLIITVAGLSSRFNRDTERDVLKCLYHEGNPSMSLLCYQINNLYSFFDEIVVVGGYKYDELVSFAHDNLSDPGKKVKLVYNEHYSDYGSCYSLIKGIEALSVHSMEVVFIEGDLFFDVDSIQILIQTPGDGISINREPILSNKAVALYIDTNERLHYLYDTSHSSLFIPEPFSAIYNSGQIWKFSNSHILQDIISLLPEKAMRGTNLEIVQRYFGESPVSSISFTLFQQWFNCNTVMDYRMAIKTLSL